MAPKNESPDPNRFPVVYWAWACKPDGKCYRVIVTVAAPGARTRSEWTAHVYRDEREAARDVERHNAALAEEVGE